MDILSLFIMAIAIGLLLLLAYIDFKTFLLPNIFVFPFAALGIAFHLTTDFYYLDWRDISMGAATGYGTLYFIRMAGNKYYGQDSLGLGDVKLLGAAGLWLGLEGVLFAMTLGAFAGLVHGLIYAYIIKLKTGQPYNIKRLMIPAGPGFIVGILCVGGWLYWGHILSALYNL